MAPLTVCVAATPPPSPTRSRAAPPPWVSLPCEVTSLILQKLGTVEILRNARRVCTTWLNICKDPTMFRVIDIDEDYGIYDVLKLCRYAVDLSQGQLVDITFPREMDKKMIDYIASQSPKLRCLRMTLNGLDEEICIRALREAVKKLSLLEEIHINYYYIYDERLQTTIEIINCCPLLTSLSLIAEHDWDIDNPDQLAFAVSKMSKLRHLRLFGCKMTNVGLTTILDGCCQLESLELRKCRYLELDSELGERCRQQIKHLKLPKDFAEDYESNEDYNDMLKGWELSEEGVGAGDNEGGEGEGEGGYEWNYEDYNDIDMLSSEEIWRRSMDERIENMGTSIASLTASIDGTNAKLDYLITLHQQIRDTPQPTYRFITYL